MTLPQFNLQSRIITYHIGMLTKINWCLVHGQLYPSSDECHKPELTSSWQWTPQISLPPLITIKKYYFIFQNLHFWCFLSFVPCSPFLFFVFTLLQCIFTSIFLMLLIEREYFRGYCKIIQCIVSQWLWWGYCWCFCCCICLTIVMYLSYRDNYSSWLHQPPLSHVLIS